MENYRKQSVYTGSDVELKFTEYTDEYGSIALLSDPDREHAWIQSTIWTDAER